MALNDNAVTDTADMLQRQLTLAGGDVEELEEVAAEDAAQSDWAELPDELVEKVLEMLEAAGQSEPQEGTQHCQTHGGGRRCQHEGCKHAAYGASEACIPHGGGDFCPGRRAEVAFMVRIRVQHLRAQELHDASMARARSDYPAVLQQYRDDRAAAAALLPPPLALSPFPTLPPLPWTV